MDLYYIGYFAFVIVSIIYLFWYPPLFKKYWGLRKPDHLKKKVWVLTVPHDKLNVLNANIGDIVIDKVKATNDKSDFSVWRGDNNEYGIQETKIYARCKNKPAAIRLIGEDWELDKTND